MLFLGETVILNALEVRADPVADLDVGNMHKLNTNLAAVSGLVGFEEFAQLPGALLVTDVALLNGVQVELTVKVLLGKSVGAVIEKLNQFVRGEAVLLAQTTVVLVFGL